ncbi:14499_t:CDS:2 [Cetraspora pellucida]|uniref:14499_t:CDS:1 n=1 Tax=Cetraspora pellucida TaxID=1433469 RepID=A0A9N9IEN8_9GLOM|nr:14499_t:CDS:2 [Cetraspora pellucida]
MVCQTYKNVEKNTIEAIYKFPLHEAAAVCGFEAEIDGKKNIKGIVKKLDRPCKNITRSFRRLWGLPHRRTTPRSESEKVRFVFPTAIAPQYSSSGYSLQMMRKTYSYKVPYSGKTDYYLDLTITCRITSVIQNIESPSHHISTK